MKSVSSIAAISICLLAHTIPGQAQDVAAGEQVFRKCSACHNIGEGARNSAGPALNGVLGRVAGTYEGFRYSKTLTAAGDAGLVWTPELVRDYIADPKEFMKAFLDDPKARPRMNFKLRDDQQRADVVAYLQQFSDPIEDDGGDTAPEGDGASDHDQDDAALMPADDKVCVLNASAQSHFFAVEGKEVERVTAILAPGDVLCASARGVGWSGVVSVYESETGFEGCSRLVRTGTLEEMRAYADFDRCAWSSNSDG